VSGAATVAEIVVAAEPAAWEAAGFRVKDGVALVGAVALRLAGAQAGRRIVSWGLRDVACTVLDGLPTTRSEQQPPVRGLAHPNGVVRLDHVVAFSPDLERTVPVLEGAGLDLRRVREGPTAAGAERQAFFRLGETILEVVEHPSGTRAAQDRDAPSRFYGLAFVAEDLETSATHLGPLLGEARDAIQPGRRIATVRPEASLGLPVALMTEA